MKITLILLISLFAFSFSQLNAVSLEKRKELVNRIKTYLDQRKYRSPTIKYLKDITSYQTVNEDTIEATKDGIEKYIEEKGRDYPQEFVKNLRAALYHVDPSVFNKIEYKQGKVDYFTEILGSFIKENNEIYVIYIKSVASGIKIVQKHWVKGKKCYQYIFFKRCETKSKYVDRGFTPQEIQNIKDTLAFRASEMCKIALYKIDLTK